MIVGWMDLGSLEFDGTNTQRVCYIYIAQSSVVLLPV
jgi:hypothetical protein